MSGGGVCGKRWGYAEVSVGTGAKLGESMRKWARGMELLLPGAGCPGQLPDVRDAGCPVDSADVRAPGSGTNTMNSTGKIATPGQNSDELVDGNRGRDGEKLDPLDAKQIRGSNPTKLHHTNKSQKKLGLFLVGIFEIGEEHNKIKLEKEG